MTIQEVIEKLESQKKWQENMKDYYLNMAKECDFTISQFSALIEINKKAMAEQYKFEKENGNG